MKSGFTLIELLVVMVIMGILASIGLGSFQSSQVKARDVKRKSELNQITKALEVYYNDHHTYPLGSGDGRIMGCANATVCTWGESWQDENDTLYMITLPTDPKGTNQYQYFSTDGRSYQIYTRLENTLDVDISKDGDNNPQVFLGMDCGAAECNYGVSSTNTSPAEGRTLGAE